MQEDRLTFADDIRHAFRQATGRNRYDHTFIITDHNCRRLCLPLLDAHDIPFISIAPGEENKNLESLAKIWKYLSDNKCTRHSLIVNIGGGVITDMGSFAAAKIKAKEVTKTEDAEYGEGGMEFLDGGSHQSGNDVDLGTMPDGRRRRAEGGEAFAIINKASTRKYRKALPGIIKSINNGTFEKKYLNAFGTDGVSVNVNGISFNSKELEKDVKEIKEQGKRRYIVDSRGRMIENYKNLKRIYN